MAKSIKLEIEEKIDKILADKIELEAKGIEIASLYKLDLGLKFSFSYLAELLKQKAFNYQELIIIIQYTCTSYIAIDDELKDQHKINCISILGYLGICSVEDTKLAKYYNYLGFKLCAENLLLNMELFLHFLRNGCKGGQLDMVQISYEFIKPKQKLLKYILQDPIKIVSTYRATYMFIAHDLLALQDAELFKDMLKQANRYGILSEIFNEHRNFLFNAIYGKVLESGKFTTVNKEELKAVINPGFITEVVEILNSYQVVTEKGSYSLLTYSIDNSALEYLPYDQLSIATLALIFNAINDENLKEQFVKHAGPDIMGKICLSQQNMQMNNNVQQQTSILKASVNTIVG